MWMFLKVNAIKIVIFFPEMTGGQNMVKIGCFGRTLRWEAPIISPNFAQLLGVWYLFEILHT